VGETKATTKSWAEVTTKKAVIPMETTDRSDREEVLERAVKVTDVAELNTEPQEWNQPTTQSVMDRMGEGRQPTEPVEKSRDNMEMFLQTGDISINKKENVGASWWINRNDPGYCVPFACYNCMDFET
jgi:hypothetical protein